MPRQRERSQASWTQLEAESSGAAWTAHTAAWTAMEAKVDASTEGDAQGQVCMQMLW